jgi:hypothetical protein
MILCEWDAPEGDPGQSCVHLFARILSTSFSSVSIFSVCCYSMYSIYLNGISLDTQATKGRGCVTNTSPYVYKSPCMGFLVFCILFWSELLLSQLYYIRTVYDKHKCRKSVFPQKVCYFFFVKKE